MEAQLLIRLDQETRDALQKIARSEQRNVSDIMRQLVLDYIKDRDMTSYIDDLWARMGNKMKLHNIDNKRIHKAIQEVRKSK